MGKAAIVGDKAESMAAAAAAARKASLASPSAPNVSIVVKELGGGFVKILQEIGGPDA